MPPIFTPRCFLCPVALGIRREEGSGNRGVAEQNKVNQGQSKKLNFQFPCLCWFKSDSPHCLIFCISFPQLLEEWLRLAEVLQNHVQVGHARLEQRTWFLLHVETHTLF